MTAGAAREEQLFRRFKADEAVAGDHRAPPRAAARRQQRAAADPRSRECRPSETAAVTATWLLAAAAAAMRRSRHGRRPDARRRCTLHRRHRAGRHPFRPQQRPHRQEVAAGNARLRRAPSSMPTATAGRTSCSSTARTGRRTAASPLPALYRNNHNGTFTDITAGSGLDIEMYGMGVAIGDYDNDGRDDVYITALDGDHLFHNEGDGKFRDVTRERRHPQRQLRHQRRMVRLRSRRQARSVRRQLRAVDARSTICGARSTAPPSPTARRNRTRAPRHGSITTWATASSKTSADKAGRRRPDQQVARA